MIRDIGLNGLENGIPQAVYGPALPVALIRINWRAVFPCSVKGLHYAMSAVLQAGFWATSAQSKISIPELGRSANFDFPVRLETRIRTDLIIKIRCFVARPAFSLSQMSRVPYRHAKFLHLTCFFFLARAGVKKMTTRDLHSVAPGSRQSEVTAEMDRIRHVPTALICDNPLLRSGVEQALSDTSFALQHASAASVSSLGAFAQKPVLFIIAVRENISRICEVAGQIKEQYPGSRIVALADHFEPSVMVHSYEAGVDGFCLSATDREVLIKSLELIMLGESALPFKLIDALVEHCRPTRRLQEQRSGKLSNLPASGAEKLSPREAEILGCLMHGAPNKVIARNLHISEATIKVHVKAILRKLGADNRTQAAMWATEHLSEKAAPSLKF